MSEILDVIGSALQTAGVGTLGSTIFLSRAPASPDALVTIYETGAGYPLYTQGSTSGAALIVANIQVVARAAREDYQAARTKITDATTALEALNDSTISGIRILRVEQVGTPTPLGLDDNDRPRVAMTYTVTYDD
jgi:hypothetical protein